MFDQNFQIYYHVAMQLPDQSWLRVLAGLFVNLAAFWYGAAYAVLSLIHQPNWLLNLTGNLFLGTVCLIISVKIDRKLTKLYGSN